MIEWMLMLFVVLFGGMDVDGGADAQRDAPAGWEPQEGRGYFGSHGDRAP